MEQYPGGRKHERGFTLLEIVVVFGILGIMASITIPAFSSWLPNYRLKRAVQDLYSNMQLTKMGAIKTNTNQSITFLTTGNEGYTTSTGTSILFSDYNGDVSYGRPDTGSNVTYADSTSATFDPRGLAELGEAYLTNGKGTYYQVGTLSSGVIRIRKWNGSAWEE